MMLFHNTPHLAHRSDTFERMRSAGGSYLGVLKQSADEFHPMLRNVWHHLVIAYGEIEAYVCLVERSRNHRRETAADLDVPRAAKALAAMIEQIAQGKPYDDTAWEAMLECVAKIPNTGPVRVRSIAEDHLGQAQIDWIRARR